MKLRRATSRVRTHNYTPHCGTVSHCGGCCIVGDSRFARALWHSAFWHGAFWHSVHLMSSVCTFLPHAHARLGFPACPCALVAVSLPCHALRAHQPHCAPFAPGSHMPQDCLCGFHPTCCALSSRDCAATVPALVRVELLQGSSLESAGTPCALPPCCHCLSTLRADSIGWTRDLGWTF